jgi:hypothetical protein
MPGHDSGSVIERLVPRQRAWSTEKTLQFGSLAGWLHTFARESRKLGIAAKNAIHTNKDVLDLDRKFHEIFRSSESFPRQVVSAVSVRAIYVDHLENNI